MSPQPGRPRKNPLPPPVTVDDIPTDREDSVELTNTINRANDLITEKLDVLKRLQSARILAHMLIENESGSQEQVKWVREHLPRKTKKDNGDETEAASDEETPEEE